MLCSFPQLCTSILGVIVQMKIKSYVASEPGTRKPSIKSYSMVYSPHHHHDHHHHIHDYFGVLREQFGEICLLLSCE